MNLSKNVKVIRVMNGVSAGMGDEQAGQPVDMAGFEGVTFIVLMGAISAGAQVELRAEQGALLDVSDGVELQGKVVIPESASNKAVVFEVFRPLPGRGRYIRPIISRVGANVAIDGVIAIQNDPRTRPTEHDVTVALSQLKVSPEAVV